MCKSKDASGGRFSPQTNRQIKKKKKKERKKERRKIKRRWLVGYSLDQTVQ